MSEWIRYEAWLMLLSFLMGAWLMMIYDTLRVFRLVIRHGTFWMGAEDFLYWLYGGFATFMLLYEQNNGVFRMYVVAGVFLGMVCYDRIISRFLFRCLKKAGKCFKIVRNDWKLRSLKDRTSRKVGD